MDFKISNELTKDEMLIREEVFMQEQGFKNEFDDIDDIATHIVLYDDNSSVGCCRVYPDETAGRFIFGRLAVKKNIVGKIWGEKLWKRQSSILALLVLLIFPYQPKFKRKDSMLILALWKKERNI